MAGKIKGITISIGGETTGLQKALADVNKKTKDLSAELRATERLLKLDPSNTTLLAQKQKLLAEAVANSKEKLDRLKTAQEQVNEQFRKGEINEEQYRAFQREVVKAEQDLKKFESQLKNTGMTAEQLGKKMQDVGQKMTDVGQNMSLKVTAPIVGAGVAAFKFAADLEDAMGATDQIFGKASGSTKKWADGLESYYGIAEGEALEYTNMMGSLLKNIGNLSEEEAARQSQVLVELAGDLTAMFGGTTADAVRALTGALKGNTSMLDNYGIAANEAMVKAKALEMGLVSEGEQMTLAAKQAATLALIMEQTGAAQGQAAREADGASGTLRGLTTELKNVASELGQILIPIITPFIAKIKEMVAAFGEMSPSAQKVILAIAGIAAAIGPVLIVLGAMVSGMGAVISAVGALSGILPALSTAFAVLTGPIGWVIAAVAALTAVWLIWGDDIKRITSEVVTSVTEWFTSFSESIAVLWNGIKDNTIAIWTAIKDFLEPFWTALKDFATAIFTAMQQSIEVITATIQIIITTIWTAIKNFLEPLWEALRLIAEIIFYAMLVVIQTAMETIQNVIATIWTAIKNFLEPFWAALKDFAVMIFNLMLQGIEVITTAIKTVIMTIWTAIKNFLEPLWNGLKTIATTIFNATKDAISTAFTLAEQAIQKIWSRIKSWISEAWEAIKRIFTSSFSTLYNIGKDMFSAMWDGMKDVWQKISNWVRDKVNWIKEKLRTWRNALKEMTSGGGGGSSSSAVGLATGGIVTKPTFAWIGEAGESEAVIPLSKLQPMLTAALADALGKTGGAGTDYDRLGQALAKYIKPSVTLQNNNYGPEPLSPSQIKRKSEQLLRTIGAEWGIA